VGQKVHPYGFRLGYNKDWHSHWYAKRNFGEMLHEDLKLKAELKHRFAGAGVSHVDIERAANRLKIIIYTSRPGIIIGRKGAEIDRLKEEISARTGREVLVSIQEITKPELNAQLQAEKIAQQLEKRIAFRRAIRKTLEESQRFGAMGIKVMVSGRLNGAEIARSEWYLQGQLPLHTLRADIDYGFSEAYTTYGVIGIKCWTYRGEILDTQPRGLFGEPEPRRMPPRERRERRAAQEATGPAVQPPPAEMPHPGRTAAPMMPPLSAPQPAWKQEIKQEEAAPKAGASTPPPVEPAGSEGQQ
jgi:small subunit ribosomal protein S3